MYFEDEEVIDLNEEINKENKIENVKKNERGKFAVWTVGDESFRLKLGVGEILELEKKFKCNLISLLNDGEGIPPLTTMLIIVTAALRRYHPEITKSIVEDLYAVYLDEGGSIMDFYSDVYMDIFANSGFFTEKISQEMQNAARQIQ